MKGQPSQKDWGKSWDRLGGKLLLPDYRHVRGWLLIFCIILVIVTPIVNIPRIAGGVVTLSNAISGPYELPGIVSIYALADIVLLTGLTLFSVYAGLKLWRIRPAAVKIAKLYLFAVLGYAVIHELIGWAILRQVGALLGQASSAELGRQLGRTLPYFVICYIYLWRSKRVKTTYYPKKSI